MKKLIVKRTAAEINADIDSLLNEPEFAKRVAKAVENVEQKLEKKAKRTVCEKCHIVLLPNGKCTYGCE